MRAADAARNGERKEGRMRGSCAPAAAPGRAPAARCLPNGAGAAVSAQRIPARSRSGGVLAGARRWRVACSYP
jgi:hypothetical protein